MDYLTVVFAFLFITDLTLADQINLGCDPGWYDYNGYCYLFNNQKLISRQQASNECSNQNAFLLRVESSDELAFVKQTIANMPSDGYWTDMSDLRFDGTNTGTGLWMWGQYEPIDNTTIKWNKYPTPDSQSSCAAVNVKGSFINDRCSRKMGYICEIPQSQDTGCPFGWLITDTACFFFSDTTDPTQLVTWTQAKNACASKPLPTGLTATPTLVTLDNPTDAMYIKTEMPEVAKTTMTFWTGLTRQGTDWDWFNGDQYDPSFYTWSTEPDNVNGMEHCATILLSGLFSDQDCKKQFNYICRKDEQIQNTDFYLGCSGWTRAAHKCYVFYDGPPSTWSVAKSKCQSIGGQMLKIENLDEKSWLEWQMTSTSHQIAYWTGLNDQQQEMKFRWADGTPANQSLIKWNQEPNSWQGNEDCAVIFNDGTYNDRDCTLNSPFICEVTANGVTCPSGWKTRVPGDCYYFSPANQTMTWTEANDYCHNTMAVQSGVPTTLLAVNSKAEMTWINTQLSQAPASSTGYWTSLNDRNNEGTWMFYDPPNNKQYDASVFKWAGEPNDKTGNEDCVIVAYGGRYKDTKCGYQRGFICERYATGQGDANGIRVGIPVIILTCLLSTLLS